MKSLYSLLLMGLLVFSSGCGGGLEEDKKDETEFGDVSDSPLIAKIGSVNWEFRSGAAKASVGDPNRFSVNLYESLPAGDICKHSPSMFENMIAFSVSRKSGTYSVGKETGTTLTFIDGSHQAALVASQGVVALTNVSSQSLAGKLKAEYNQNTYADGRFIVTVCP